MLKKTVILLSFLIVNQISAQQNQISVINNTGLPNNFVINWNNLQTDIINSSTSKQDFNIPDSASSFSITLPINSSRIAPGVLCPRSTALVYNLNDPYDWQRLQIVPGRTYRIMLGNECKDVPDLGSPTRDLMNFKTLIVN